MKKRTRRLNDSHPFSRRELWDGIEKLINAAVAYDANPDALLAFDSGLYESLEKAIRSTQGAPRMPLELVHEKVASSVSELAEIYRKFKLKELSGKMLEVAIKKFLNRNERYFKGSGCEDKVSLLLPKLAEIREIGGPIVLATWKVALLQGKRDRSLHTLRRRVAERRSRFKEAPPRPTEPVPLELEKAVLTRICGLGEAEIQRILKIIATRYCKYDFSHASLQDQHWIQGRWE